jgi:hypothetical protein
MKSQVNAEPPLDPLIRSEINEFVRFGWMEHVLSRESWWDAQDGKLKIVRRQNIAVAYNAVRRQIHRELIEQRVSIYRALLLPVDFDVASLLDHEQDFGIFWTSCSETASFYKPRRNYQSKHPMPEEGLVRVVKVDAVGIEDVDWVATTGCRLSNPTLSEVRLVAGTKKQASNVFDSLCGTHFDGLGPSQPSLIRSTPPVAGIVPVPEGPGFLKNFRALCRAEGSYC